MGGGGGGLRHGGHSGIAYAPKKWCERRFFQGRGTRSRNKTKKIKEKGNEQVRIKAKRAGTEQERKEREMFYCNSTQLAPLSSAFSLYVLSTDLGAALCLNDLQPVR
jgi:hypothetical protein